MSYISRKWRNRPIRETVLIIYMLRRHNSMVLGQKHESDNRRLENSRMDCLGCNIEQEVFAFSVEFGIELWQIARFGCSIKLTQQFEN